MQIANLFVCMCMRDTYVHPLFIVTDHSVCAFASRPHKNNLTIPEPQQHLVTVFTIGNLRTSIR